MHNLIRPEFPIEESLKNLKKGLHKPKSEFIKKEETRLLALHKDYDVKAASDTLYRLSSPWSCPGSKKDNSNHPYWVSHSLYDNIKYDKYWQSLVNINGGRDLICPICGVRNCSELDHYAPREKFPEYSCHYTNLIPLCHECNKEKTSTWLDGSNKRIFFNAFFDKDVPQETIICNLSKKCGVVIAKTEISPSLNSSNPVHYRIIASIRELRLLKLFDMLANEQLRNLIITFKSEYEANALRFGDVDSFIDSRDKCLSAQISNTYQSNFLTIAVLKACLYSDIFKDWLKSEISSSKTPSTSSIWY